MKSKSHKCLLERKFTLIELLITIAIIAILAAMLLPVLNKARDKGKSISCTGNSKQIGAAFMLYVNDADDYFPHYTYNQSYTYKGSTPWKMSSAWTMALYSEYLGSWNVFQCPAHITSTDKSEWKGENAYVHYGYNYMHVGSSYRYVSPNDLATPPAKAAALRNPGKVVLTADSINRQTSIINSSVANSSQTNAGTYIISDNYGSSGVVYPVHFGGANVLWADGHVTNVISSRVIWSRIYESGFLGSASNSTSMWNRK